MINFSLVVFHYCYSHVVGLLGRFGRLYCFNSSRSKMPTRLRFATYRRVSSDTRTMEQANGSRKAKRDLVLWRCRYLVDSEKRGPSIYLVSNEGSIGDWRTWQKLEEAARLDTADLSSNRRIEVKRKRNLCVFRHRSKLYNESLILKGENFC